MIKINNLTFTYQERSTPALSDVTLSVERGEFITVCGASGSGKSTLLRLMKPSLTPVGECRGTVFIDGCDASKLDKRTECQKIGLVMQSPEDQIVCDKVWHELAFGLENLGLDTEQIRARVAECAEYFGLADKFDNDVSVLSGGEKQLLTLACVMAMRPEILLLDEPTAQLDPIAASEYLAAIGRLNRELGVTVILVEHRLEDAFSLSDRIIVMDNGRIVADSAPNKLGGVIPHGLYDFMPAASRVWHALGNSGGDMPLNVRDGRAFLTDYLRTHTPREIENERIYDKEILLSASELCFRYEDGATDTVKSLSISVHRGELLAILGGNGSGKTTALSLLAGINRQQSGEIYRGGRVALLPQEPSALFCRDTVRQELSEISADFNDIAKLCGIENILDVHPFDLSGGEKQRVALAKLLLSKPDVLLVDEPTKGMDNTFKHHLAEIFKALCREGKAIIMVSHDAEFCAENADTCALFFDGGIVSSAPPREFFTATSYYTTAVSRMTRGILPSVTAEELIQRLGGEIEPKEQSHRSQSSHAESQSTAQIVKKHKKITPHGVLSLLIILMIIPLTIYFGGNYFGDRRYYIVSLLVTLEALGAFLVSFEGRRPSARELAVTASLCALGVAGRAVFFMLPECKPVIAITVVAGAALGANQGFAVGALTMLVSNLIFGQGPWTPWQMLAMGLVGLIAGGVFRVIKTSRISLCIFGVIAAIAVYGTVTNAASALIWLEEPTFGAISAYFVSGFPLDLIRAASTAVFLLLAGMPMAKRLSRIRNKIDI